MLETVESSLINTPFVDSIEDCMFVERIERAFRRLNVNTRMAPEVLDIMSGNVLDRMWYAGSRGARFVDDIATEHRLRVETTLSSAKLCVPW